jgi:hypothetical protein
MFAPFGSRLTLSCNVRECGAAEQHGVKVTRHDPMRALLSSTALAQPDQAVRPNFDDDVVLVAVRHFGIMHADNAVWFSVDDALAVAVFGDIVVVNAVVIAWVVPLFDSADCISCHIG